MLQVQDFQLTHKEEKTIFHAARRMAGLDYIPDFLATENEQLAAAVIACLDPSTGRFAEMAIAADPRGAFLRLIVAERSRVDTLEARKAHAKREAAISGSTVAELTTKASKTRYKQYGTGSWPTALKHTCNTAWVTTFSRRESGRVDASLATATGKAWRTIDGQIICEACKQKRVKRYALQVLAEIELVLVLMTAALKPSEEKALKQQWKDCKKATDK